MSNILQPYVSGPADVFVGTGADGALECLGFCQQSIALDLEFPMSPVRSTITGQSPYDQQFMGKGIRVNIRNLNIYDEEVLVKLLAVISLGAPGEIPANRIGTLLRLEGHAPRCLIRTRYGLGQSGEHAAFRRMIPVVNIPAVRIVNQVSVELGTEERMWNAVLEAIPSWDFADGSADVWNTDSTGIPTDFTFLQPGDTPAPTAP